MTLNLNISINLNTANFDDLDNHLIKIADHLSQLINTTNGDPEAIIIFIKDHIK